MTQKNENVIKNVEKGSLAQQYGIQPGDVLLSVNGYEMEDVFDYYYQTDNDSITLEIRDVNTDQVQSITIEKDPSEDLGISFEKGLMDDYRSCHNKCIFCFIDQMPPGMRDTLYFKDDDTRLSFLQGNYVTLTNMKDKDLDRVIRYHLSPINISVQATDPELRCKMLHNRFAGDILEKIEKLAAADVEMNGQIVLCKGINDGEQLQRSISDLYKFHPHMKSLSVVPVGLSKYRDGLYPLEPFEREDAVRTIEIIEKWQQKSMEEYGDHFVQASDEWYLLAGLDFPAEDRYDGYIQLENGVGMMRLLWEEFHEALAETKRPVFMKKQKISIATGRLAGPMLKQLAADFMEKFPKIEVNVYEIRNDFFGERITVSGLITGQDLMAQLKGVDLGDKLLLPINMLRMGELVFLDDYTVDDVERALQVKIDIVKSDGLSFVQKLLGVKKYE